VTIPAEFLFGTLILIWNSPDPYAIFDPNPDPLYSNKSTYNIVKHIFISKNLTNFMFSFNPSFLVFVFYFYVVKSHICEKHKTTLKEKGIVLLKKKIVI